MSKKLTTEEWILKASKIHNSFYDYSKVEYKTNVDKVIIICPIHGEFIQKANSHTNGSGCPKCSSKYNYTSSEWIDIAKNIHKNKYDYSMVKYINAKTKVCIICLHHGEFWQLPSLHVNSKCGCPICANNITLTNNIFKQKANSIHNFLYDYEFVDYLNNRTKVKIICKKHGEFWQTPDCHLQGQGCPICRSSKGERLIHNWLKENNIPFKAQFELITPEIARNTNRILIDFFVKYNDKQYFIEYDGIQHFEYNPFFHKTYEDFENQQRRDKVLNEFCELHRDKVTLIRFKYDESNENVINKLKNFYD